MIINLALVIHYLYVSINLRSLEMSFFKCRNFNTRGLFAARTRSLPPYQTAENTPLSGKVGGL
ncbi:hypothetical protein F384_23385 [Citrobacter amalonaticus Y19]|uniref:Uncharacterized protein n=1 Tax=Citrobacter amalonaticus Y19 TaxID=1261127 RepID=A0A0F6TYV5_CITAM|nr:hypothetical protein F384_23385 [Citrobacter amalonaticus Y19]ECS7321409.1 hypothetical protein [Salmonella enterica subsp. enterica serovar Montevideo]EEY3971392.1 hypothetical protein [Escherichia coli]EEY5974941.1 hypothetical protein [Escherichia coli]MHA23935.1 hypothetical protein [Salmonella enterica]